jgi:hypothetical protein
VNSPWAKAIRLFVRTKDDELGGTTKKEVIVSSARARKKFILARRNVRRRRQHGERHDRRRQRNERIALRTLVAECVALVSPIAIFRSPAPMLVALW